VSVEPAPLAETVSAGLAICVTARLATGGRSGAGGLTVMLAVFGVEASAPVSVTTSVTVYGPAVAYVCVAACVGALTTVAVVPSPQSNE
jgi:hypothetical protein